VGGAGPATRPAALATVISNVDFEKAVLGKAIELLANKTGANIVVDWRGLEAAGVGHATTVDLHVKDVTMAQALTLVLRDAGGASVELGWRAEGNVIEVSTLESVNRATVMRVYDVRELIRDCIEFSYTVVALAELREPRPRTPDGRREDSAASAPATRPTAGAPFTAPSGSSAGGLGDCLGNDPTAAHALEMELVEGLMTLITESVDRESWVDNGGRFGQIKYWSGLLVITETAENHDRILELLQTLMESRSRPMAGGSRNP
jgi:hypothetical protein